MTRNITRGEAVGDEEGQARQPWERADSGAGFGAEFDGVFGELAAARWDAELRELAGGPPWQPVAPGDVPSLLAAYRHARELAGELARLLAAAGIEPGEVPGLCGSVDAAGRPVVVLGAVSARTAARLAVVLCAGGPVPPATGRGDRAA